MDHIKLGDLIYLKVTRILGSHTNAGNERFRELMIPRQFSSGPTAFDSAIIEVLIT